MQLSFLPYTHGNLRLIPKSKNLCFSKDYGIYWKVHIKDTVERRYCSSAGMQTDVDKKVKDTVLVAQIVHCW